MTTLLAFGVDALIFIAVPWLVWRLLGRSLPLAVLPILVGLLLAASGYGRALQGVPSVLGDQIGFAGVLLLAFTAGLEMRQPVGDHPTEAVGSHRLSVPRLMMSAGLALVLPFVAGAVAAYHYFNQLPGWTVPSDQHLLGAMAIGLCVSVSALPVLIGLVRELPRRYRPLGQLALGVAVIDDAVLWVCLAVLLLLAGGSDAWGV
jgi:Kef-type K+ transport system membrane component KefB